MKQSRTIIDAHNVMHAWEHKGLASFHGLEGFLAFLGSYADAYDGEVCAVFDGESAHRERLQARFSGLSVVFSSPESSADAVIERMVHYEKQPGSVTVVTSDQLVVHGASAAGANVISPLAFFERLEDERKRLEKKMAPPRKGPGRFPVGDIFDGKAR